LPASIDSSSMNSLVEKGQGGLAGNVASCGPKEDLNEESFVLFIGKPGEDGSPGVIISE